MLVKFGIAKVVLASIEAFGWIIVILGIAVGVLKTHELGFDVAMFIAAGMVISGLFLIALIQMSRAQIATAESTAELVVLARDAQRNKVSKLRAEPSLSR